MGCVTNLFIEKKQFITCILIINLIFKSKGNASEPSNYRQITLLSCFGKLFTSILNIRLQKFSEDNELINQY